MSEQKDTREDHSTRINNDEPKVDFMENSVLTADKELEQLITDRVTLEKFYDLVAEAGKDGLTPVADKALRIALVGLGCSKSMVSTENYVTMNIGVEDIGERLKAISKRIMELIDLLIEKAKVAASKIMTGITGVINEAESLLDQVRNPTRSKPATELYGDKTITINNPHMLMANGEFCSADCKSEIEVVKFLQGAWPQYAIEQIKRAGKMIAEYDVESGNSDNFRHNAEFLGNHESLVTKIKEVILPGNKSIAFKYVALGPELVDAEDAEPAPAKYTMDVRDSRSITMTLKENIEHMRGLSKILEEEAKVLNEMKGLSKGVQDLEGRRGETIFKGARDDLDEISSMIMGLINRLKPNLDPIVRHLARVGTARNAVCKQELATRG